MDQIKSDNLEKMLRSEPSEKLLVKAIKGLKVGKKDRTSRTVLTLVCIALGTMLGMHTDTVIILQEAVGSVLDVSLSIFGVIFTGYALFQAFMGKQLLIHLLSSTRDDGMEEKSSLHVINEKFVCLMLLHALAIVVSLVLKIALLCIPNELVVFEGLCANNAVASVLIILYLEFTGIALWRTMGFISTVFQLLNAYAVTRIIEIQDEESE